MKSLLGLGLIFTLGMISVKSNQSSFDYLKIAGHKVETTHRLKYMLKVARAYAFLGETNYQPTFDGKGFNVSLAAFAGKDSFVMIHAETHTDGSGGLDYSKLQPDTFSGIKFTSKEECAELDQTDIDGEHDLRFLKDNGFNPFPAVYIKQYFTTSADGSSELVITYGKRIRSCKSEVVTSEFKAQLNRDSRTAVKVVNREK